MCDVLVTADGIELWSITDARRYGVDIPAEAEHPYHGAEWCLCGVDLAVVLAGHASTWRAGDDWMVTDGWAEVGADGRTWSEGYDITEIDDARPYLHTISRSDGRRALTLEEWEAARGH